jgi:putative SOS response-associated peptidase YedK
MCVRYTLRSLEAALLEIGRELGIPLTAEAAEPPRYNVAPSQIVPAVAREAGRTRLRPMRWGFIPPADRNLAKPRLLTNCRSETMTDEFKDLGRSKEPYLFTVRSSAAWALAGLWEPGPVDGPGTFCLVTTDTNTVMRPIHNRLPLIVTGKALGQWLGEEPLSDALREELIRPAPDDLLALRRVNQYVNNSRHEGPQCVADPEPALPELF